MLQGALYAVVMLTSTLLLLRLPPKDFAPAGYVPSSSPSRTPAFQRAMTDWFDRKLKREPRDWRKILIVESLNTKQAVKTPQFWLLWVTLFLNIHAGITFLSLYSLMLKDIFHYTTKPTLLVSLTSVGNLSGRFLWAFVSDYIGRRNTGLIFCVCAFFVFHGMIAAARAENVIVFGALTVWEYMTYGGGFALAPAWLADVFGTDNVGAVHGVILTAWSIAGIVGPSWISRFPDWEVEHGTAEAEKYFDSFRIVSYTMILEAAAILCLRELKSSRWMLPEEIKARDAANGAELGQLGPTQVNPSPGSGVGSPEGSEADITAPPSPTSGFTPAAIETESAPLEAVAAADDQDAAGHVNRE
eukprot:gnl/Ergobibamus_cyprinoides/221.p1 GENE.gnl/Ergobibamus_cyprinoides/221~~gnl/Ergobibamus_cyprinoides/221.p1  ORF type:complete len:387 (+),score=155.29 gnl/Ergobibamus_cyprinoides/221:90-1163(+)